MKYLDHPFRVSTASSRRPTPLTYEHLRKWFEPISRSLPITSVTQLQNVNQFLEQQATLYISNIIQQSIAQLIGQYGDGFKTIKATEAGALHVYLPENLISSQALVNAKIDIVPAATTFTISGTPFQKIHIVNIFFTVSAETNIVFLDTATPLTGAMDFGAEGEPRGVVLPFGLSPLICSSGEDFVIEIDPAVQVSGFCIYYKQPS